VDPTSQPPPEPSGQKRHGRRARVGAIEGWLSLVLVIAPYLAPAVDHPSQPFGILMFVGIFGAASLLALDGFRFSRGSGRMAAAVSLAILSLFLLQIIVAAVMRGLSH